MGGANVNAIIDSIDFDEVTVEHGGSEINLFGLFKQVGAEGGMYVDREDECRTNRRINWKFKRCDKSR